MKIWSTEYADIIFSRQIRLRDPVCVLCLQRPSTDCSHHFERGNSGTRFHPLNGDGVCRECHNYWHSHRAEYIKFKKEQISARIYLDLQRLAKSVVKRDEAIIRFMRNYDIN